MERVIDLTAADGDEQSQDVVRDSRLTVHEELPPPSVKWKDRLT